MRSQFIICLLLILFVSCKKHLPDLPKPIEDDERNLIDYHKDLTIVNWNMEWFGVNPPGATRGVKEANTGKVLKYLQADLYGLCEVVDTAKFGKLIGEELGSDYGYLISPYATVSQKLAFVFNRNIFRKATARPMMGISSTAWLNFAFGRFPWLLSAEVAVNGVRKKISFLLIHAKANADSVSYISRVLGAQELKDSIDQYFSGKPVFILGDFNDQLNSSIMPEKPSPYQIFVHDSATYQAVTLPLNSYGHQSTLDYENSVIDQQIITRNMSRWYVPGSARIRTDVTSAVPDYRGGNTSDHYPISSVFRIRD